MEYDVVQSRRCLPTFRRNVLPPFSESKNQLNDKHCCSVCCWFSEAGLLASLLAHPFGLLLNPEYVGSTRSSGSRDSAVGIAIGYGLDDGWVGV
jgi:hypothetical protein